MNDHDRQPPAASPAGSTAQLEFTVTQDDTASAVGSGSLPVLGTPRLLAWMEAATCAALEPSLPEGSTSVGTHATLEHTRPSPTSQRVQVTASVAAVEGREHRFTVVARHVDDGGQVTDVIGTAQITRMVVDAKRFMAKVLA